MGYSLWDRKELDVTERLGTYTHVSPGIFQNISVDKDAKWKFKKAVEFKPTLLGKNRFKIGM